jgi:hypothetical protein
MKKHFIAWVSSLLFLLVLGGVQSVYRLTSLLCMARAEPAYQYVWLPPNLYMVRDQLVARVGLGSPLAAFSSAGAKGGLTVPLRGRRRLLRMFTIAES